MDKDISINAVGLMSGTSLDGVDISLCNYTFKEGSWSFNILNANTLHYPEEMVSEITNLPNRNVIDFVTLDIKLGDYYGKLINDFLKQSNLKAEIIGSHGHTIFHQPEIGITTQIGNGSRIAAITGIDTVCDFRSKDVALKGQGAPLVPIGDLLLFSNYSACINLGGIANISFDNDGTRLGYDICAVNMLLNNLANKIGLPCDWNGDQAKKGAIDYGLYNKLNQFNFYQQPGPKSLGREWVEENVLSLLRTVDKEDTSSIQSLLATTTEHIAYQISRNLIHFNENDKVMLSGGGALNTFLVERIKDLSKPQIICEDKTIIDFKEAIVFGFLAVLYKYDQINILKSTTGCLRNHIGGALYKGG